MLAEGKPEETEERVPAATVPVPDWLTLVPFVDAEAVAVSVSSPAFAVAVAVPVDCVEAAAVVTSPFAAV